MCNTDEHGEIIIRTYPKAYGYNRLAFEVEALLHAATSDIPAPRPIPMRQCEDFITDLNGKRAIIYKALVGKTIRQDELSSELATRAGTLLCRQLESALKFEPRSV